ncbi:bifunctional metallophosphatase/5'-nucleotidase [Candidatus Bipolaricaulota bacterium]
MTRAGYFAASALAGIALLVCGIGGLARPLTILYTNDLHLRFARLASIRALIEEERSRGAPILLLDAGDGWQDFRTPLTAVWGADEMVEWMNDVGYNAMAIGNHELYWGPDRLAELVGRASFPILCANLDPAPGFLPPFIPSTIRSIGGIRILLVGVVTKYHLPFPDFPWLRYVSPAVALAKEIAGASEPVDLIVAVGHIPVDEAAGIVREIPEIDVFVTGHSHEETHDPVRIGDSLIVQAGRFAERLGVLILDVDEETGEPRLVSNDLLPTTTAPTDSFRGLLRLAAVAAAVALTVLLVLL